MAVSDAKSLSGLDPGFRFHGLVVNDTIPKFVPEVALLVEALPREAGAAADVEDHARLVGGQGEQLEGAIRHLTLDLHHASAAMAF